MQTPKPGAASTTTCPRAFSARSWHIYAITYILKSRSAEKITAHRKAVIKKAKGTWTPLVDALFDGAYLLEKQANESLAQAVEQGLLLFCWDGSRVTELTHIRNGGAA